MPVHEPHRGTDQLHYADSRCQLSVGADAVLLRGMGMAKCGCVLAVVKAEPCRTAFGQLDLGCGRVT
jgi:hypothetical protein